MEKIPITAEGASQLQEELKNLKSVERPAVIKAIAAAREHGDLSENAEYHAARERQAFVEARVADIEDVMRRAEVIDVAKLSGKDVKFGATVTIAGNIPGRTRTLASAIYSAQQVGVDDQAWILLVLALTIGFVAILASEMLARSPKWVARP